MTRARFKDDGTVVEIRPDGAERPLTPQVDWARIDATTEEEIAAQIAEDDAEAVRDAAAYARRVRQKLGLSQVAFARRIGVPVDTVRNWEQGSAPQEGLHERCFASSTARPKRRCRHWRRTLHSAILVAIRFSIPDPLTTTERSSSYSELLI